MGVYKMTTFQEYRQSLIPKLPPGMTFARYQEIKRGCEKYNKCHKMALSDLSDARRDVVILPKLVGIKEFLNIKRRVEYLEGKQPYTNPQHSEPKIEPQIKIVSL